MLHYVDLFFVLCNVGKKSPFLAWVLEEKYARWIYVTQTTPGNLILLLSYPRVLCVLPQNSDENLINAWCIENNAVNTFEISKFQMILRKS